MNAHGPRYGYQPPPKKSGGVATCLVVGLILGGLGMICVAFIGVGAVYMIARDSESARPEEDYARLSPDERAIRDALEQQRLRERELAESTAPPASFDDAVRDLNSNSDTRRKVAGRWLSTQTVTAADKRKGAEALATGLNRATSEDARFACLLGLQVWGGPQQAETIANVMRLNRDEGPLVQLSLDLLQNYRSPATVDEIASLLSSPDHGRRAVDVLTAFGPSGTDAILDELDVSSETAMNHARILFANLGEDVDLRLLDLFLAKMDTADQRGKSQIADELAKIDSVPNRREQVAKALDPLIQASNPYVDKVIRGCKVWATETNSEKLIALAQGNRFRRNEDLIEVIVSLEEPDSIGLLASLLDDSGTVGRLATDALEEFAPSCEAEVLAYYNASDQRTRERARRILAGCDVDNEELVAQCLADLSGSDVGKQVQAMKTLTSTDVEDASQNEIAKQLIEFAKEEDVFSKRRQPAIEALEQWATLDEASLITPLIEHRDDSIWRPAFRILVSRGAHDQVLFETAEKLGSFDQQKVADELIKVGPVAEPLAIKMLEHTDKRAVQKMCQVLAEIGGQASLDPLREIAEYAQKHRAPEVTVAANLARDSIRARIRRNRDLNSDDDDSGDDDADGIR